MSLPVFTTVGVKKNCVLSLGMKLASLTAANSSGDTFIPNVPCGSSTVRVPTSRVETSKSPRLKPRFLAFSRIMPSAIAGPENAPSVPASGKPTPALIALRRVIRFIAILSFAI